MIVSGPWPNARIRRGAQDIRTVKPPETAQDMAEELRRQALHDRTILLEGNGTKRQMAGAPVT